MNAAVIEFEKSLPSQMRAAEAEKKLAESEFARSKSLFEQNAGAEADVDRDEANYQTAVSKIEQLRAASKAKEAEIRFANVASRESEPVTPRRQTEPQRLHSLLVFSRTDRRCIGCAWQCRQRRTTGRHEQMMDPIKIEVEVSAEDSRRLRSRQRLAVRVPLPDGTTKEADGFCI